jgi:hypothetical protein
LTDHPEEEELWLVSFLCYKMITTSLREVEGERGDLFCTRKLK